MIGIFGCGFVGEALADNLVACGKSVMGFTHSAASAEKLGIEKSYPVRACDISNGGGLPKEAFDWVVHCASSGRRGAEGYREVYLNGCKNLVAAYPKARLIYTSSTSVYPQTDGSVVTESSHAEPDRETGELLRLTENFVLAQGGIVVRLAGLYGPSRCYTLKKLFEGTATIEVNREAPEGRYINQIHRADAAGSIEFLTNVNADSGVYNAVDSEPIAQLACYKRLSAMFGLPLPPTTPPDTNRKRGWTHKYVSNQKLRNLGWRVTYPSIFEAIKNDPNLVPSIRAQSASQ